MKKKKIETSPRLEIISINSMMPLATSGSSSMEIGNNEYMSGRSLSFDGFAANEL